MSIKLNEQQLKTIREIVATENQIPFMVGQLELKRQELQRELTKIEGQLIGTTNQYFNAVQEKNAFLKGLEVEHGVGYSLNLETGELTKVGEKND